MAKPLALLSVSGFAEAQAEFDAMRLSMKPIIRQAAKKVGSKISREAKAEIKPAQTKVYRSGNRTIRFKTSGTLRKAISYRATTSKKGIVHSIIGAKTKTIGTLTKYKGAEPMVVKPYKYIHLVEKGFMHQGWGRGRKKFITGKNFLEGKINTNREYVTQETASTLQDGLARAAAKKKALIETL